MNFNFYLLFILAEKKEKFSVSVYGEGVVPFLVVFNIVFWAAQKYLEI